MLDPLANAVLSMMGKFGGDATLVVDTGDSTYDPTTSTTTPSVQQYPIRLIAEDYIQKSFGISSQIGGLVQTGDKQMFIQPVAGMPVPRPGVDFILLNGQKWGVSVVKAYNPSGVNAYLYEVFARQ